jgi:hypothetical protein
VFFPKISPRCDILWPKEKSYCSSTVAIFVQIGIVSENQKKKRKREKIKKKRKKCDKKELSKSAKRYTSARKDIS